MTAVWSAPVSGGFTGYKVSIYQQDCLSLVLGQNTHIIGKPEHNFKATTSFTGLQVNKVYCVKVVTTCGVDSDSELSGSITTSKNYILHKLRFVALVVVVPSNIMS